MRGLRRAGERIISFDLDLKRLSLVPIDRPVEADDMPHLAWCAINPANGLVYSCDWNHAERLEQVKVWLGPFGGAAEPAPIRSGIHGFDATTGTKIGYVRIPTRPHFPHFEEIEGLALGPMTIDGTVAHAHLAMLDRNHSWLRDDVHSKSFTVPDPELL